MFLLEQGRSKDTAPAQSGASKHWLGSGLSNNAVNQCHRQLQCMHKPDITLICICTTTSDPYDTWHACACPAEAVQNSDNKIRPALAMHARRWLYHTLQHQWHAVLPFQKCVTPVAITAVYNTLTAAGHHGCALTGSSNTERLLHENQHLSSTKCAPSSVPVFVTLRQRPTFAPCQ